MGKTPLLGACSGSGSVLLGVRPVLPGFCPPRALAPWGQQQGQPRLPGGGGGGARRLREGAWSRLPTGSRCRPRPCFVSEDPEAGALVPGSGPSGCRAGRLPCIQSARGGEVGVLGQLNGLMKHMSPVNWTPWRVGGVQLVGGPSVQGVPRAYRAHCGGGHGWSWCGGGQVAHRQTGHAGGPEGQPLLGAGGPCPRAARAGGRLQPEQRGLPGATGAGGAAPWTERAAVAKAWPLPSRRPSRRGVTAQNGPGGRERCCPDGSREGSSSPTGL